jgi:hypothetical protein
MSTAVLIFRGNDPYLFRGLCNSTVRSLEYIASNGRMIVE